jgi:hypothetical protein
MTTTEEHAWVPQACILPSVERPVRLAEFDELFATAVRGQRRLSRTALSWDLDPVYAARARELAGRESGCCSFFTFAFRPGGAALRLDVEVPLAYAEVLDALQLRAAERVRS